MRAKPPGEQASQSVSQIPSIPHSKMDITKGFANSAARTAPLFVVPRIIGSVEGEYENELITKSLSTSDGERSQFTYNGGRFKWFIAAGRT